MRELLAPIERTARLCGMDFLPPFVAHGTHGMSQEEMALHARDYVLLFDAIRKGTLDFERARTVQRLNKDLQGLMRD
jgi:glutathione-regulated potassium-efflux system ancillary protein KefG